jgi:hypothetical protein
MLGSYLPGGGQGLGSKSGWFPPERSFRPKCVGAGRSNYLEADSDQGAIAGLSGEAFAVSGFMAWVRGGQFVRPHVPLQQQIRRHVDIAHLRRSWVPRGSRSLAAKGVSKTEFTLDHSMLVLASKLDPDDEDLRRVIAGVNGVSVHSYKFAGAGITIWRRSVR